MNEHLLLLLPHRQMVFTFLKVLRVFFRHDRRLYGEITKLVYRMIQSFYNAAARRRRRIQSAAVIAYASAGEFARWNPYLHAIFLEGGFDREGRFVHVPSLDLDKLSQYFRASIVDFFLKHTLLNERLVKNKLDWTHSGFSVDLSIKIPATSPKAREALALYIARPPVSLKKMLVEENAGNVLYRSEYNRYFRTDSKLFPVAEFLVEVLQHLPDAGARLIRRYGLYSSRARGTWSRKPHHLRLAPEGWRKDRQPRPALRLGPAR